MSSPESSPTQEKPPTRAKPPNLKGKKFDDGFLDHLIGDVRNTSASSASLPIPELRESRRSPIPQDPEQDSSSEARRPRESLNVTQSPELSDTANESRSDREPRPRPHREARISPEPSEPGREGRANEEPRGRRPRHRFEKIRTTAGGNRLVIAIDFGTTYTGVAYATPQSTDAELEDINVIYEWGPGMGNHDKIPSIISYSPASSAGEQQWGASISPDAVTMVNTKMELDVQDNKSDELALILQVLDGMGDLHFDHVKKSRGSPDYTWKSPEIIVTDYLTHVFQYLDQAVSYFGPERRNTISVDIVLTIPVNWSYRAKNSTLRAVRGAGFNESTFLKLEDIIMVTEPEAAAIYAARYLKEEMGRDFLKVGECFVLCDAGGGTVDCVSYKVKKLEPNLEIESVTFATGAKCGSAFIDRNFKRWLSDLIGDRNYRILDPKNASEKISAPQGKDMRAITDAFDRFKRQYHQNARESRLYLPDSLQDLNIGDKIIDGELIISNNDMKSFFDPCVDAVVELVQGQIQQVERQRNRVKNIILIGGFGESKFLQEELEFSMRLRKIQLRRPQTSWTAVVRGAAIYGIEKANQPALTICKTCPRSYGIMLNQAFSRSKHGRRDLYTDPATNRVMVKGQMAWLIKRGDLVLSDEPKEAEHSFSFKILPNDAKIFPFAIYEYPDDDLPERYETAQNELNEVDVLNVDFSSFDLNEFDRIEDSRNELLYYKAQCKCKFELIGTTLNVSIWWNDNQLCTTKIEDGRKVIRKKSSTARGDGDKIPATGRYGSHWRTE